MVAVRRAEEFYERVLVGYGDDSVAELAGAHVAVELNRVMAQVIPSIVQRAIDVRYVRPAEERMVALRERLTALSARTGAVAAGPSDKLVGYVKDAERKVVQAALFPHSDRPLEEL